MSHIRTYRMSDDDDIFFEENNLSWTSECDQMIQNLRNDKKIDFKMRKREKFRAMSNDLIIFFFGVMCLGISYVVINWLVFIILNIGAMIGMGAGIILLIREAIAR